MVAVLRPCVQGGNDEILRAIRRNELRQPAFHTGCWLSMDAQSTQPGQTECMQTIEKTHRLKRRTVPGPYEEAGCLNLLVDHISLNQLIAGFDLEPKPAASAIFKSHSWPD
jgi:hypothetical protein